MMSEERHVGPIEVCVYAGILCVLIYAVTGFESALWGVILLIALFWMLVLVA
jgi:hypothetical protein